MSWILKLIAEGEHQQQDFKLRIDDSRKIAKTLVAFANSDGGRLLIGVKDNSVIAGCRVDEEIHMIEAAAGMYSRPRVEYESQVWQVDFLKILEIRVGASDKRPHYAEIEEDKWRAYLRKDDEVFQVNQVMLKVWEHEGNQTRWEFEYDEQKEKLFKYLNDHPSVGFRKAARITGLSSRQTEDLLAQLITWDILEMSQNEGKGYSYSMRKESSQIS